MRALVIGAFLTAVLTLAISWQFTSRSSAEPTANAPITLQLAALLPDKDAEWNVEKLQLGKNEHETEFILRALRCDSYVYNRYTKGRTWFSVYVAYWSPGKAPVYYVARKTPDACWPRTGMEISRAEFHVPIDIAGIKLQPAEVRIFSQQQTAVPNTHVLFWLLVDGKSFDYGSSVDATFDLVRWWREMIKEYAMAPIHTMYFIRVAANEPLQSLISRDVTLQRIVRDLGRIGLTESLD